MNKITIIGAGFAALFAGRQIGRAGEAQPGDGDAILVGFGRVLDAGRRRCGEAGFQVLR